MITIPGYLKVTDRWTDGQLALVIPRSARLRAVKAVGDTVSVQMDHQSEMAYGESNGHVIDDVM